MVNKIIDNWTLIDPVYFNTNASALMLNFIFFSLTIAELDHNLLKLGLSDNYHHLPMHYIGL